MAKHRTPRKRSARKAALVGVTAAGIASGLVLGHATNVTAADYVVQLSNTVIGAGGLGDNVGDRVKNKLSGTVVPAGYQYAGLVYDSGLNLGASRDAGAIVLDQAIADTYATEPLLVVTGYSSGTLAVEQERRHLQSLNASDAPSREQLSFVQIASPFSPNGGVFQRLPAIAIPGIIDAMGVGQATRYDTTTSRRSTTPTATSRRTSTRSRC